MDGYPQSVERQMAKFCRSLNERDRRRYAAVEAAKLGHGGVEYISRILGCDPKTIARGTGELQAKQELPTERQRQKGADASR